MNATTVHAWRRLPAQIVLARAATSWLFFANGTALGSWAPRIPDVKHALAVGDMTLGFALLAMAAGSLIGLPLSGALTARLGSRRTATAAIFALLAATPLPLLAPTLPAFAVALALLGMANGAIDVAMNAQGIAVEERHGKPILSSFHGLFSAGGLVGAGGAGIAMSADIEANMHLLGVVAILFPITLLAAAHLLPVPPAPAGVSLFRLPQGPILRLGILAFCALLAEGAIGDWGAVYLRNDLHAGAATAALGFAAFSLTMAIGRFCGDALVQRYGGACALTGGAGVAALLLAGALLLASPDAALVGFAAVGLGLANAVPIVFGAAGKVRGTPPELALAAVSTAGYCGFLSGPPLIGLVAEHLDLGAGLGLVAMALGIVAFGRCAASRRNENGRRS